MNAIGHDTDRDVDDTFAAPELETENVRVRVQRGNPKARATKVSTTIRLDPDVLDSFKASGPGWQSRINDALRRAAGLK